MFHLSRKEIIHDLVFQSQVGNDGDNQDLLEVAISPAPAPPSTPLPLPASSGCEDLCDQGTKTEGSDFGQDDAPSSR